MRIASISDVGKHVVVQGGTFLNDAVLRALELLLCANVTRPDIAGHMGAFGAALEAQAQWNKLPKDPSRPSISSLLNLEELKQLQWFSSNSRCGKCPNNW